MRAYINIPRAVRPSYSPPVGSIAYRTSTTAGAGWMLVHPLRPWSQCDARSKWFSPRKRITSKSATTRWLTARPIKRYRALPRTTKLPCLTATPSLNLTQVQHKIGEYRMSGAFDSRSRRDSGAVPPSPRSVVTIIAQAYPPVFTYLCSNPSCL
jgi:hypothetical protein